tara:strand:+ start:497 stop:718 length:222 start_codon:yes stop_codon:yes gene_type:complete
MATINNHQAMRRLQGLNNELKNEVDELFYALQWEGFIKEEEYNKITKILERVNQNLETEIFKYQSKIKKEHYV